MASASNSTVSSVNSSTSAVILLNSRQRGRIGIVIHNNSTSILYIKYGSGVSSSSYTYKLAAGSHWEMPNSIFSGVITGIWESENGNAKVTEVY